MTLIESSIGISISPLSNKTPPIPPFGPGSKRKTLPEEKSNDESPTGSVDNYFLYPLVIDGYLKIGDVSGRNGSINSQTLSQQYWYFNNGDVSCGNIFYNNPHF